MISPLARLSVALTLSVSLALPTLARAAGPDQVDAAVAKGVTYLYGKIAGGNAEASATPDLDPDVRQELHYKIRGGAWGGLTSMTCLALLVAGEKPDDPRLAKAIDWLEHNNFPGTYATALRAQVFSHLPYEHNPALKKCMEHDAEVLVNSSYAGKGKNWDGMYCYFVAQQPMPDGGAIWNMPGLKGGSKMGGPDWYDHSNSQMAVLGVWSLAETGVVEIPHSYWENVDRGWKNAQHEDGGWSYRNEAGENPTFTQHTMNMSASGVATLYITEDYLRPESGCNGNVDNKYIEAGIKWMAANFNDTFTTFHTNGADFNPATLKYYATYAVERVGQASGRKYVGNDLNWYQKGSDRLVAEQAGDGSWGILPDTCLAMYFLCHGRAPVMLNKLEYSIDMHGDKTTDANWNERPHDAAHIARWTGRSTELEFNWQVVNLRVPVDELHDAPILYIAGNQDLDFTAEELAKLKQFCEDGGLIMFNADCGASRFSTAVRKLGTKLFPQSEFRELPADHPIYTEEQFKRALWKNSKLSVEGLSNGARELMILYAHDDPARLWQSGAFGGHEDHFDVAADVFEYIAGNIVKLRKGVTFIVRPTGGGGGPAIKVARLQYPGMSDPEPAGWRRLAAILHNSGKAELTTEPVNLGEGKLTGYTIAHLTGTYSITLTDAARAEIKAFVNNGGTLIIDSCGGSGAFTASMQSEMSKIFAAPDELPILKPDNPVFAGIDKIIYRRFAQKTLGKHFSTPRPCALQVNGKPAVYFSPEDLSVGLVGVPVDGIYGYDSATACSIMTNILLAAAH